MTIQETALWALMKLESQIACGEDVYAGRSGIVAALRRHKDPDVCFRRINAIVRMELWQDKRESDCVSCHPLDFKTQQRAGLMLDSF